MDYKSMVGQKVVRCDNVKGVIKEVDKEGAIHIKFEGDAFSGGYLFDPFLAEQVRFLDETLQKEIDEQIAEIDAKQLDIINKCKANNKEEETYYITKQNTDGINEVVISLKCSYDEALKAFSYVIKEQQREMRKNRNNFKWRVVRLFESKTDKQLRQES